jgi:hypothetical protein
VFKQEPGLHMAAGLPAPLKIERRNEPKYIGPTRAML